jgi:hypothetical protein
MTQKQKNELDFLCKIFKINPIEEEIKQYFDWTVKGKNKDPENIRSKNCLFQAKRKWDMHLKDYKKDGMSKEFLIADFNHPYATKCLNRLYDNN